MTDVQRRYGMTRPCPHCPFRTDVPPYLRRARANEISASIQGGADFPCHKTTVPDDDDPDGLVDDPATSRVCAGSLIVQAHSGAFNQMARVAMTLGAFDPEGLDMTAPVHTSFLEWVDSYPRDGVPTSTDPESGEVLEWEHCNVVAADCEDPAGYSCGGGAVENDDPPTIDPLDADAWCQHCGSAMCPACRSGEPRTCVFCAEGGEEL